MSAVSGGCATSRRRLPTTRSAGRWRSSIGMPTGLHLLLVGMVLLVLPTLGKPVQDSRKHDNYNVNGQQEQEQQPLLRDGCDRTIWSSAGEKRAVHQLAVTCSEGSVLWHQADGALRVVFNPPVPIQDKAKNRQLETCFHINTHLLKVIVSRETRDNQMDPVVMLSQEAPRTAKDTCIKSGHEPVSLFLETQPGDPRSALGYIQIDYDVTTVSKNDQDDNMEECRPCTDSEILLAACSMDFVVEGYMNSVLHSIILEQSTIDVTVTQVHRQKTDYFRTPLTASDTGNSGATLSVATRGNTKREAEVRHGFITAPYKCRVRYGPGDFLFMARLRLGRAFLQCAPRAEEFRELWTRAVKQGTNPCTLD